MATVRSQKCCQVTFTFGLCALIFMSCVIGASVRAWKITNDAEIKLFAITTGDSIFLALRITYIIYTCLGAPCLLLLVVSAVKKNTSWSESLVGLASIGPLSMALTLFVTWCCLVASLGRANPYPRLWRLLLNNPYYRPGSVNTTELSSTTVGHLFDYIQYHYKCCGVESAETYARVLPPTQHLPHTCCVLKSEVDVDAAFSTQVLSISGCMNKAEDYVHTRGCGVVLHGAFKKMLGIEIGISLTIVILTPISVLVMYYYSSSLSPDSCVQDRGHDPLPQVRYEEEPVIDTGQKEEKTKGENVVGEFTFITLQDHKLNVA